MTEISSNSKNACEYSTNPNKSYCEDVYDCCDCGKREDGCGCPRCWSCNACDNCYNE